VKTHILITAAAIATLSITACTTPKGAQAIPASKVPPAVLVGFQKQVPGATAHGWEIENGDYIPLYKQSGHEYNGLYSKSGAWLGTEEVITWEQTPKAVKDAFARSPPRRRAPSPKPSKPPPPNTRALFEMNVTKDGKKYEIVFTPKGEQTTLVEE
jgi:hypothetical protein